ncbi:MAG: flagellin FliC5 [Lachnospiraceae bacterium]|nr:flagellin FliC5 [Lachnospiraceae bacterium]
MSSVSAVSNNLATNYQRLSSGSKINSAADNASGLAIAEKEEQQIRGTDQGTENAKQSKALFNVSDSALSTITDYLQRIRELAVQSINGTNSDSDKSAIQKEIDQLKEGIADVAGNTKYNETKPLDGSVSSLNTVTGADGSSTTASLPNMTLEALGLEDFDITGEFSLDTIDSALEQVSSARSSLGATVNALDYTELYNQEASMNLTEASNGLTLEDYVESSSELKKNTMLQDAQFIMQKNQQDAEEQKVQNFFI